MRWNASLACAGTVLLLHASAAHAQAQAAERAPDGLSASDWSSIRAAYDANRHAAIAVEGSYQARNPGQQWRTRFDFRGFETTPDAGDWSWGLDLASYGIAGAERLVDGVAPANSRCGKRIEYEWDDHLTEWYVNDQRGLEHGYTMHQRPDGGAGALRFTLAVRGNLDPRLTADARGVTFTDAGGTAVVTYSGLTVFDARGAMLPAWFEVGDFNSPFSILHSQFVRIIVDDTDGIYPLTIDPIAQQAYLKASNTGGGDLFGLSVAVSGETVVVGAYSEDSNAMGVNGNQVNNMAANSGAAYVFVRSGGIWSQQAYLKASNTGAGDAFGYSVAASGDTVVVGAIYEESSATGVNGNQADNSAPDSGAAYVFVRNGSTWSQQAYLKASNAEGGFPGDEFGVSVALFGDTVAIGAWAEDSSATGVNGNQADNSAPDSGATYVFVRDAGGVWSQQAYLKASNTGAGDAFGYSVAASGDTVVVGAFQESSSATGVNGNQTNNNAPVSGAAYIFVRDEGAWSQQAYLKASNTGAEDYFGHSVGVSGDTVVVGAWVESSSATGVNGNQADNSVLSAGAAYVFSRSGTNWAQEAYLKASNTNAGDWFGWSVAVSSGDTVVVGAFKESSSATGINGNQADNSAMDSGAAYVYFRSGGVWSQQAYLKASNTGVSDSFGFSVAASDDTVVVGAYDEDSNATGVNGNQANNNVNGSGAAYVFTGLLDIDGDGVPNADDPCPINNAALIVDNTGRPLSDLNDDCNINGLDMQIYVNDPSVRAVDDFVADLLL